MEAFNLLHNDHYYILVLIMQFITLRRKLALFCPIIHASSIFCPFDQLNTYGQVREKRRGSFEE